MASKFPKSSRHNFNKNLVKRHKLVTHLDAFLVNEPKGFQFKYEPKLPDDAWHPSGDCTPTVTELYLKAVSKPEPREFSAALQKTFAVGHFWHQLLQWAAVEIGFAAPSAIEARGITVWDTDGENPTPHHWATGQADIAPCSIPVHGDFLVDFKTMGNHDFKTAGMPIWAAEKYEAQINIYLDWFDLERALIVGVQKDSPHEMKEFEFVRNQPLIDRIYEKWHFVSHLIDNNEVPSELENEEYRLDGLFQGPVAQ